MSATNQINKAEPSPRYTTVIFDVDGTIMDTAEADLQSMEEAIFQVTGERYPIDELKKGQGMPGLEAMRRLGVSNPEACHIRHKELFPSYQENFSRMFPGIAHTLSMLTELGITLGIVTSRDHHEFYTDALMTEDFQSIFGAIVVAEMTEEHKPHAAPLEKGMELLHAAPSHTLYVGDSTHDFGCATACGVDFALATWGAHWDIPQATYHPTSPTDILKILEGTL